MNTSFATGLNLIENIVPSSTNINIQTQALLFGSRTTDGILYQPPVNSTYAMPNLFIPFQLPSFSDGISAVNYLVNNFGYQVTWGVDFTLVLPAPDQISTLSNNNIQFTWSAIPTNFNILIGAAITGTVTQLTNVGTIVGSSIQIINNTARMTVTPISLATFNTTDTLSINGVNNIQKPNPSSSDQIVNMVFAFYNQAVLLNSGRNQPNCWISVLNDNCTTVNPVNTPIELPSPNTVTINPDTSMTVTYPSTTSGLGYLPTTMLGSSIVTQSINLSTDSINVVYFANDIYLKGSSSNGGIQYASDGINWVNSNIITGTFTDIYYNGTSFIATSTLGLYSSTDGITWTITTQNTGSFNNTFFANNTWVATSTVGLYYTLDITGATGWTITTGAATGLFRNLAFGLNTWVATSSDNLFNSTDGITWTALAYSGDGFNAISFANGQFQVGSDVATDAGISYSLDGTVFTASNITTGAYNAFVYNNGLWISVGNDGISSSTNGTSWLATNITSGTFNDILFANNEYIAVSTVGIYSSDTGILWGITNISTSNYNSLAASSTLFITGGTPGITFSTNGSNWAVDNDATGTYNGFVIDSLGNVDINIINITGIFNNDDPISIVLDVSQSAFDYIDNYQICEFVLPFQITTLSDLQSIQSTFYDAIQVLNNGYAVQQQKFLPQGYYANMLPKGQVLNLQTPNTQIFKGVWKSDQPYNAATGTGTSSLLDYTETPGTIASAMAYADLSTAIPFYSQANVVLNLSVNSNQNTYPGTGQYGDCNQAIIQGWTSIAVNNLGQPYIWRNVTSLTTIPNTLIQDKEYRYQSLWQKQRWLQQQVWALWEIVSVTPYTNGGMQLNSASVRQDMKTGCQAILQNGENLGMLQNVALYSGLVTVVIDPLLPTGFDVTIPNQVIPELATANVTVNIFSIYNTFTA